MVKGGLRLRSGAFIALALAGCDLPAEHPADKYTTFSGFYAIFDRCPHPGTSRQENSEVCAEPGFSSGRFGPIRVERLEEGRWVDVPVDRIDRIGVSHEPGNRLVWDQFVPTDEEPERTRSAIFRAVNCDRSPWYSGSQSC